MTNLAELDFIDLYVRVDDRATSRYSPRPQQGVRQLPNLPVPIEFEEEIGLLRGILKKQEHNDFSIDLEEMRLRVSRQHMFGNETWCALRRFPLDLPDLDSLGFRGGAVQAFRAWGRRNGLIIVGGGTGAGKTTTAVGLLVDFLRIHGRVAYTVEDPVEFYLHGQIGDAGGYVFQVEVHEDEQWGAAVKTALRWAPRYIFVGEVRTPAAARHLLRAATSGHLVICTVHGGSVEETLGAILQVAEGDLGPMAASLLADGLVGVIHQSIQGGRPAVQMLQTEAGNYGDPIRAAIRTGKLSTIATYIHQQAAERKQQAIAARNEESGRQS